MLGQITLSRRNLLTLLHKLEMPGSSCTIVKPGGFVVHAEPDEVHYKDRPEGPGPMHPETEQFVTDMQDALEAVRRLRQPKPAKGCNCGACHRT
jgi:hypothetical protein